MDKQSIIISIIGIILIVTSPFWGLAIDEIIIKIINWIRK